MVAVLVGGPRGNHDDRQLPGLFVTPQQFGQFKAIHARHFNVQQHDTRHYLSQLLQRIHAILGCHHLVSGTAQQTRRDLAHGQRVIHYHDQRLNAQRYRYGFLCLAHSRAYALCHLHRVQDQYDRTIAQHGRTGNTGHVCQLRADVLHDRFLVTQQFIHM